jgi:hypothetical protein
MTCMALPLSFIGIPDWHVIRWIKGHPTEAKVSFLFAATVILLGVLCWSIISLELDRRRVQDKLK